MYEKSAMRVTGAMERYCAFTDKLRVVIFYDYLLCSYTFFFFSSRRRHTRSKRDWSSDVCSSDLYPWSREVWALLMDKLFAAGARLVMFDIVFGASTDADAAFQAALDKYRDRVVKIGRASCRERV